ncbi:MAG: Histidine--tRNA ligase [Candidatus Berkelbacteria bacterium Licking1014_2]|uniref:Histidine--tRNA ligase n=1 Tax=Candidatus Berkelbacteria bacterium Licking1014_2 TaxID=2017146 RepID=A0A554LUC5_9BACT|nr:MAG: Histidine--tRNA ligase [Candidatus Berkelbacteria bacterium Licking1014_2]
MEDKLRAVRGMEDILPERARLFEVVRAACQKWAYYLAERKAMDDKEKEEESERRQMVLRPEYTTGVVRAYFTGGMKSWSQPVKLWYFGPNFRYEKPQAGRWRQFWQAGVEVLNDANPVTDALVIFLGSLILDELNLAKKTIININSIGCPACRPKIIKKIRDFLRPYRRNICQDCQNRLAVNPLRILDCKDAACQKIIAGMPTIVDQLCPTCVADFRQVLECLDDLGLEYRLDSRLVRGLDYYTKTVFEINEIDDDNRQSTLLGGGRYDGLGKAIAGEELPAVGWSAGVERLGEKMGDLKPDKNSNKLNRKLFIIMFGNEKVRQQTLKIIKKLSRLGIGWDGAFSKDSLKSQLRAADKSGLKNCLIIGQREAFDKSVIWRNLQTGSQESLSEKQLEKKLGKFKS